MTVEELIRNLGVPHRATRAWWDLFALGDVIVPQLVAALDDPSPDIRLHCVRLLDHFPTEDLVATLAPLAHDPDPRVRVQTVHALACDRCKPDKCAPGASRTVRLAIDIVRSDPNPLVRAMAIELLGKGVHDSPDVVAVLEELIARDPSPAVRKKARWYAPGGPIHRRTAPAARRGAGRAA